jgi:hypothetical protein
LVRFSERSVSRSQYLFAWLHTGRRFVAANEVIVIVCSGLDQIGSDWIRLDQIGSDLIWLDQFGCDWISLDQIGSDDSRMTWGWLRSINSRYFSSLFFQETVVIELEAHHLCPIFMGLNSWNFVNLQICDAATVWFVISWRTHCFLHQTVMKINWWARWDYHAFLEMANSELSTTALRKYVQYTVCMYECTVWTSKSVIFCSNCIGFSSFSSLTATHRAELESKQWSRSTYAVSICTRF